MRRRPASARGGEPPPCGLLASMVRAPPIPRSPPACSTFGGHFAAFADKPKVARVRTARARRVQRADCRAQRRQKVRSPRAKVSRSACLPHDTHVVGGSPTATLI